MSRQLLSIPRSALLALPVGLLVALPGLLLLGQAHQTQASLVGGGKGPQPTGNIIVTVRVKEGEQVFCTPQSGGAIAFATAAGAWARQVKSADAEDVKAIDVVASRFQFEPATISVTQGDRVRLRFRSADAIHSIAIKAFRVKALIPKAGEPVTVEFVADRVGTFPFTCAEYCGTGHGRMKGRLVVLAPEK